jgi:hypothetical protein
MSSDVLRQGETVANVFFNIMTTCLYMALMQVLDGRGVPLFLSNDSRIAAPSEVLAEIVGVLLALAMSASGLTTHARKNKVHVQPFAREAWMTYLDNNPRNSDM